MATYRDVRNQCARGKYANGGRIAKRTAKPTVININVQPPVSAPASVPVSPSAAPQSPPAMPSPGAVPPQAAALALNQMQGKPQPPGFNRGGRVQGGAESGVGRLQKAKGKKK